jgi:hypothetical protein
VYVTQMDVYPPRQRSNQDDFSGSSSAGQLGSAFPPFAKSAKDGAPDRLWQGKKYAPLLLTQYTSHGGEAVYVLIDER